MSEAILEHANVTVSDPRATAEMLGRVFGWRIRWEGGARDDGCSIHVGGADSYLAIYRGKGDQAPRADSYSAVGGLNHVGVVVVEDLDAVEEKVRAEGYEPYSFGDYEPGRRFYFRDRDGIEIEVVSYA